MMKFAVSICATRAYTHAMEMQARRVQQCIAVAGLTEPGHVILSGDNSKELGAIKKLYEQLMPEGWRVHHIGSVLDDPEAERPHKDRDFDKLAESGSKEERAKREKENAMRKARAFRRIGDMREAAHACALKLGITHFWSLDSDVLPPPNALRASLGVLNFDGGYYSIAFCPYPNMLWLGGLGEPGHPMGEDFLPLERALSRRLRFCLEECERRIKGKPSEWRGTLGPRPRPATNEYQRRARLEARARTKPSDGNIWEVIAKYGWRRRGWVDHVYPGIGKGALLPSDWCGFGCTLMNAQALALADFSGYRGQGTEDVFVIAQRWQPADLRIGLLTHCPCDHVHMERRDGKVQINFLRAYHEPAGEYRGHLRVECLPFVGEIGRPDRAEPARRAR